MRGPNILRLDTSKLTPEELRDLYNSFSDPKPGKVVCLSPKEMNALGLKGDPLMKIFLMCFLEYVLACVMWTVFCSVIILISPETWAAHGILSALAGLILGGIVWAIYWTRRR